MRYKIVAVRKFDDGTLESVKLQDGNVVNIDRAIDIAKAGFIQNAHIEMDDSGREYLKPNASNQNPPQLEDFPIF